MDLNSAGSCEAPRRALRGRRIAMSNSFRLQMPGGALVSMKSGERLVNLLHAGRTFADRSGDPFHAAATYIADRKDSREIGLKGVGHTLIAPAVARQVIRRQIEAGPDEGFVVERDAPFEPWSRRYGSGHQEDMLDRMSFAAARSRRFPSHAFEVCAAIERYDFGSHVKPYIRGIGDAAYQIVGHAVSQAA
jgi:hypothetical protein